MEPKALWPLVIYFGVVIILAVAMLALAYFIGERHREPATSEPYESGMLPTGSARVRFPADFYLVAMFFVIFDLETVFIVSWAIAMRQLGWAGYYAVAIFIGMLFIALVYLWRTGALDWGPGRKQYRQSTEQKGATTHAELR